MPLFSIKWAISPIKVPLHHIIVSRVPVIIIVYAIPLFRLLVPRSLPFRNGLFTHIRLSPSFLGFQAHTGCFISFSIGSRSFKVRLIVPQSLPFHSLVLFIVIHSIIQLFITLFTHATLYGCLL